MARLPVPSGDDGVWGSILNEYLLQAHKDDGTLRDNAVGSSAIQNYSVGEDKLNAAVQAKLNKASVESVNSKTGVVVLNKADVGLGSVDNTSDADKPISTATQSALNTKVNLSSLDTDDTLAANSNDNIATQRATKSYVDNALATKANTSDLGSKVILINTAADLPQGTPADVIVVVKEA